MPINNKIDSDRLSCLLGQKLIHNKQRCEVVELLDDTELVLQALAPDTSIQATQYGEGHRAVPVTYIVSIFDEAGNLNPALKLAGLKL